MASLDPERTKSFVTGRWDESIVPTLERYIRIPNKSPTFDPDWQAHGHMDQAVALAEAWCRERPIEGIQIEVVRIAGRTPLLFMEVPGTAPGSDTVVLYGHLDKQPEMTGWSEGLDPWIPVRRGDKLYGRGGADDGYATFASLTAVEALREQGVPHARAVIMIECCEESGSFDLPFYIDALAERIGKPSLVVCLDSGCANYDQLWCTTSLRGIVVADLTVELLREGVHSGGGGGIVPDAFRVARMILGRLEEAETGRILPAEFHAAIPADRAAQATAVANTLGTKLYDHYPFHAGVRPSTDDTTELVLSNTWRPSLTVTGAAGLPELRNAGNVLLPRIAFRLSFRLPPTLADVAARSRLKELLERDPPYGAKVTVSNLESGGGWNAPALADWLQSSMHAASRTYFGQPAMFTGEGGSIPFMGMLGARYPEAQFLITGVLGPGSNAHGPNEFLHIPTGKNLTCCVAQVLEDHAKRS